MRIFNTEEDGSLFSGPGLLRDLAILLLPAYIILPGI